jgi:hypothetical protein
MRVVAVTVVAASLACASSNTAPGTSPSADVMVQGVQGVDVLSTGGVPIAGKSTVKVPFDKAWSMLPDAYASLSIPLTTLEPQDHLLGNRGLQVRRRLGNTPLSRYINCGSAQGEESANSYAINLSVITQLQPADSGRTKVTTTVDAVGKPVLFSGEDVHCATTGAIETWISKLLAGTAK